MKTQSRLAACASNCPKLPGALGMVVPLANRLRGGSWPTVPVVTAAWAVWPATKGALALTSPVPPVAPQPWVSNRVL